jgi:hypothetical protein
MTLTHGKGRAPIHWLLRITFRGFDHEPIYIEIADPHQTMAETLAPVWETLHSSQSAAIISLNGKEIDYQQSLVHLPSTTFFSGEEKWAVIEIILKPRPAAQSGVVCVSGNLPLPGDYEPSYASNAVLTQDELLGYIEDALLVKSLRHKFTLKSALLEAILRVIYAQKNITIESERVNRAIESTVRKFGLSNTVSRIVLTNLFPRGKK